MSSPYTLSEFFENSLKEKTKPDVFLSGLFFEELSKKNILLRNKQKKYIQNQFSLIEKESIELNIDFSKTQIRKAGFNSEDELGKEVQSILDNIISVAVTKLDQLENNLPEMVESFSKNSSNDIYKILKKDVRKHLRYHRRQRNIFIKYNYRSWKDGLDHLLMLITFLEECLHIYKEDYLSSDTADNNFLKETVIGLHSRACLVALEIHTLLINGFPDGAHSRWRTLHELTTIAMFIHKNGSEVAEKFLLHADVDTYKYMLLQRETVDNSKFNDEEESAFKEIQESYNFLIEKYGKFFSPQYGWASGVGGLPQKPNFRQIEDKVDLTYFRFLYKEASNSVHASSSRLYFKLGVSEFESPSDLTSSTNLDIDYPAKLTAMSLTLISIVLFQLNPTIDNIVCLNLTNSFSKEIIDFFNQD